MLIRVEFGPHGVAIRGNLERPCTFRRPEQLLMRLFRWNVLETLSRSKRRSTRRWTIVAVPLRSQMLYPVELRAPRRAGNLRRKRAAVK